MELAVGMFTVALLLSACCYFVSYIRRSLTIQTHLRTPGAISASRIALDEFAVTEVFGMKSLQISEPYRPGNAQITSADLP